MMMITNDTQYYYFIFYLFIELVQTCTMQRKLLFCAYYHSPNNNWHRLCKLYMCMLLWTMFVPHADSYLNLLLLCTGS